MSKPTNETLRDWIKYCSLSENPDYEMVIVAAKELLELREKTRWIPVAEKLPDDKGKVLIAVENELIYMGHINNKNQWCESTQDERWYGRTNEDNIDNVTHWMPLPEPPEVKE